MMRIVVTGGAGFIGSAVIRHLIENTDHTVINVDKLTYAGNISSLVSVSGSPRYHFQQIDVCDGPALKQLFREYHPDAVMHLAAESHVDRSIDGPGEFIQTNLVGTFTLLEETRRYWKTLSDGAQQSFRFHHVSTDEVYGDLDDTGDLFTEQTNYDPSSPYSASKAGADHLVRAWQRTYGLPVVVTNCSNNYGPYHFPEKLIPHIILNALQHKPLPVYGDGTQVRDWLYVDDHARALVKVLTEGKVGETYNIGGHNEKQNIEVVKTICKILNELVPPSHSCPKFYHYSQSGEPQILSTLAGYEDLITFVADRPGHDLRYAIDASKIQNNLGWTPEESFETGIRKTVEWYLKNKKWWQAVLDGSYQLGRLGDGFSGGVTSAEGDKR